jgi:archaellum component FlaC
MVSMTLMICGESLLTTAKTIHQNVHSHMKLPTFCCLALCLATSACDNGKSRIAELEAKLAEKQASAEASAAESDAVVKQLRGELAASKKAIEEQQARVKEQEGRIDEQARTIKEKSEQIEGLSKKIKLLYEPTSTAIRTLEEFSLNFVEASTKADADTQCLPVATHLEELSQALPSEARAARIVALAAKQLQDYRNDVDFRSKSVEILGLFGLALDNRRKIEESEETLKNQTKLFRAKITECIALLREQRSAME